MIISLPKITLSVVCIILLTLSWGQVRDSSNTVRFLYPNGLISSEGELINNQPHGVWKSYFTDGKIKSIVAWNFGKLEGVSEFFSTTGFRTTTYAYLNHLKTGPAHFYDSVGSLIREVVYVNDTLHGPAIEFYSTGLKKSEYKYEKGIRSGSTFLFSEIDGSKTGELKYEHDSLIQTITYNAIDLNGNKQGYWKETDAFGRVRAEGNYVDNNRDGQFIYYDVYGRQEKVMYYAQGEVITEQVIKPLQFIEKRHANGQLASRGLVVDNHPHGMHNYYDSNGVYQFSKLYEKGILSAEGKLLQNGERDSVWIAYFPDGRVRHSGIYRNGLREGRWMFFYANGDKAQEGFYRKGLPDGKWNWYYFNGQINTEEYYVRGKLEGEKTEYDTLGNLLTRGFYINDLQEGPWYYRVGDHEEKGAYQLGEKHGLWLHYYDNGQVAFKGVFKEGIPEGKHKFWYFHGRLMEIVNYKRGEKHGRHIRYYWSGQEESRVFYKNGEIVSIDGKKVN